MEQQLRQACSELGRNLRSNQPCSAEEVLAAHPEFAGDSTAALEIIYTEFVVREELGQRPTPAAWYDRFPQWRTDLQELFQVHDFVVEEESRISHGGGSTLRRTGAGTVINGASQRSRTEQGIQGYEIEEELGRGGMGIVYKARQPGLHRTVALKMILAGEYATVEELARFRSEAAANAAVQHPNIVQIFEIGEQDGHAFIAQEYVSGGTLQRKLAEWQADGTVGMAPNSAAGLLLVLSRALHFAHQRGVVHRDLKPSNILLSTDGADVVAGSTPNQPAFTPKIADFGLAKMPHTADQQVTHTGAILGTPSYMAPEQAAGRSADIGIPTDLYALGAILYELLTGRPPFRGTTIMETLEQVRREEPVRPSRLQPSTPRDLETICLKCLQKEPHRRYASAAELADDLDRFLNGKSIVARPSGIWERAVKWSARQPLLASLLGVSTTAVVLLVGGALVSNAALRAANERERERTRQADHERKVAVALREEAERNREAAELHRKKAEQHYREARILVDGLTRIGTRLAEQPHVEKMRREILQKVLSFYQQSLKEKSTDPDIQFETALAATRVGGIQQEFGQYKESLTAYQQSVALLRELCDQSPQNVGYRSELAAALRGTGLSLARLQRHADADKAWQESISLLDKIVEKPNAETRYILQLTNTIANRCVSLIGMGRFDDAEQEFKRAIALHDRILAKDPKNFLTRQDMALSYDDLGELYWRRGRAEPAEEMCRKSYDMRSELLQAAPSDSSTRSLLARSCRNLGRIYAETGRSDLAVSMYSQAIQLLERLREEFQDVPSYATELGMCYRRRCMITGDQKDYAKATQEYRRILKANPAYQQANNNLAWHLATAKELKPQEAAEAVVLAKKAVDFMPDAATFWNTLGVAHYRANEMNEAVGALQKSIELGKDRDISNWFFLALAKHRLGDATQARHWFDEGVKLVEKLPAPDLETKQFRDEASAVLNSQQ